MSWGGRGVRTTELDVAASRVAQGVHALSLFPVKVAITQQLVERCSAAVLSSLSGSEWSNWGLEGVGVVRGEA